MKNIYLNGILGSVLIVAISTVYAGTSDELSFKPTSENRDIKRNISTMPELKNIVVTGYGVNHDKALKNAFQSAVEQQIGVLIDSEEIIKNDNIIKSNILTTSNGFIQEYTELSSIVNDGLFQVKIKAKVKSQEVERKINTLNISTLKIKDSSNIYAEITTKEKAKKDSSEMLTSIFIKMLSKKTYVDLLKVKLSGYEILKDKTKNGKTPIKINYEISFNYPLYKEKIKRIEGVLLNIGADIKIKTDYPRITKRNTLESRNNNLNYNTVSIIKKNGRIYTRDTWVLPENTKIDFTSSLRDRIRGYNKNTINIELIDKDKNILGANLFNISADRFFPVWLNRKNYKIGSAFYKKKNKYIIAPFFSGLSGSGRESSYNAYEKYSTSSIVNIHTNDLKRISSATIQYQ